MIRLWERALLEGASGVFERGGRKAPEVDEEQVKELHVTIGEFTLPEMFGTLVVDPLPSSTCEACVKGGQPASRKRVATRR